MQRSAGWRRLCEQEDAEEGGEPTEFTILGDSDLPCSAQFLDSGSYRVVSFDGGVWLRRRGPGGLGALAFVPGSKVQRRILYGPGAEGVRICACGCAAMPRGTG